MARQLLLLNPRFQKKEVTGMNKKVLIGLVVGLSMVLTGGFAYAHYTGWGGYGGHMMGPGYGGYMMGPGYGNYGTAPDYDDYCGGGPAAYERKPVTEKETKDILATYIGRNPNLKVGEIKDKGNYFEGEIVTKDNSLVTRVSIDKKTGWVQQVF
jgi:hypothetical protein